MWKHLAAVRMLAVVGFALLTLSACVNDAVVGVSPPSGAAHDEIAVDVETIAGEAMDFGDGTCPAGFVLTPSKPGDPNDVNVNQVVCVGPNGEVVDDGSSSGSGACPEGYVLSVVKTPGDPPDLNGNGYYCRGPKGEAIDDTIADEEPTKVNGHGNFFDGGKKGAQDISFSFHAIPTGKKGFEAKGQFEFHDQTNSLEVHGKVVCVALQGTTAFVGATVTRSNDAGLPEGATIGWFASDLAEPGGQIDVVSRPGRYKPNPKEPCAGAQGGKGFTIESGNIQVH